MYCHPLVLFLVLLLVLLLDLLPVLSVLLLVLLLVLRLVLRGQRLRLQLWLQPRCLLLQLMLQLLVLRLLSLDWLRGLLVMVVLPLLAWGLTWSNAILQRRYHVAICGYDGWMVVCCVS